jgi:glycosyltransferase involved in cell wall biosynthesis
VSRPPFSVVIPTIGRTTLARTIRSIREQAVPAEVIVVFDTYRADDAIVRATRNIAESYGARFLTFDAGLNDAGSPQIHMAFHRASGHHLLNCGDDDVYEPDAFATIRAAIEETVTIQDVPLMFKVALHPAPHRDNRQPVVLWDRREIAEGHVTGQSFVCPNDPQRLGRWVNDWTFMRETVALYDGRIEWRDDTIMRCY